MLVFLSEFIIFFSSSCISRKFVLLYAACPVTGIPDKTQFDNSGCSAALITANHERKLITMKKIICKVEYDTEASELISKRSFGSFGDPAGYEESLYKTATGKFFLYTFGGPESQYAEEGIKRMSAAKADEWLANA